MKVNNPLKINSRNLLKKRKRDYILQLGGSEYLINRDINDHNIKFNDNILGLGMGMPSGVLYYMDVVYNK